MAERLVGPYDRERRPHLDSWFEDRIQLTGLVRPTSAAHALSPEGFSAAA